MPKDVKVANVDEIPTGQMKVFRVEDNDVLIANINGKFYAIDDVCTHQECSLADGTLKGNVVTCPCHFSQFDVTNGKVVAGPATGEQIEDEKTFAVKVENGEVFIVLE